MTKKEMNAIRHAAYVEWTNTDEGKELLKTSYEHFEGWRIDEGDARKVLVTMFSTQVNDQTLAAMGFTPAADVRKIFEINRKSKTLTPTGWGMEV